jgi:hypothetical protein
LLQIWIREWNFIKGLWRKLISINGVEVRLGGHERAEESEPVSDACLNVLFCFSFFSYIQIDKEVHSATQNLGVQTEV